MPGRCRRSGSLFEMKLIIIGHSFRYETENIVRLFFPLEKTETLTQDEDTGSDIIRTAVTETGAGCDIAVSARLGGASGERSEFFPGLRTDDPLCEKKIAILLYRLLSGMTGFFPPWGILTGVRPTKLMRTHMAEKGESGTVGYFTDELLVSPDKARLAAHVAKAEDAAVALSAPESWSLYISIPFCPTRCSYCSFVSHSITGAGKLIPDYVRLLCREIEDISLIARETGLRLETVYMGGGTPTSFSAEHLKQITDTVSACFDINGVREYTVEAGRPDTITEEKLSVLKAAGVTRISINPQTFSDEVLRNIGRIHTADMTSDAFAKARAAGFDNINADLIAGLPGDSLSGFLESCERLLGLDPENITVHTLALKRSSELVVDKRQSTVAGETAAMLDESAKLLYNHDYSPYYMYRQSRSVGNLENVGWAKQGRECLYNIYMIEETHTVLGAGAGAVSRLKAPGINHIERLFNFKYPYEYISRFDIQSGRKDRIRTFYEEYAD